MQTNKKLQIASFAFFMLLLLKYYFISKNVVLGNVFFALQIVAICAMIYFNPSKMHKYFMAFLIVVLIVTHLKTIGVF